MAKRPFRQVEHKRVECWQCAGHGIIERGFECPTCGGSGHVIRYENGTYAKYLGGPLLGRDNAKDRQS